MLTQLLYLLRVKGIDVAIRTRITEAFDQAYDADVGYGFSNVNNFDDDIITGRLIFSSVSNNKIFDVSSNSLVAKAQTVYQDVQFEFDLASGIVALRGGGTKLRKFISTIGAIAGNKVAIDPITLEIQKTIQYLRENSDAFTLTGLLIRNYKPNKDLTGRFAAKVYNIVAAEDILTAYGSDILEFTGTVELDDDAIKIRLSQGGAVALNSTEEGVRKCLEMIKDLSSEKSHA